MPCQSNHPAYLKVVYVEEDSPRGAAFDAVCGFGHDNIYDAKSFQALGGWQNVFKCTVQVEKVE
jgi:hypothetical protein